MATTWWLGYHGRYTAVTEERGDSILLPPGGWVTMADIQAIKG